MLGWAAWISKLVLRHERLWETTLERCDARKEWITSIEDCLKELKPVLEMTNRNVVRLGMKSGLDTGELETSD